MGNRLALLLWGLVIPGAGQVAGGRVRRALGWQALLIGWVLGLCLTRVVWAPGAIVLLGSGVLAIHVLAGLDAVRLAGHPPLTWRGAVAAAAFSATALGLAATLFWLKPQLLGLNIYYIPTYSMAPTLAPGDIILVDTWAYRSAWPQSGEIATFNSPIVPKRTLIKRVRDTEASPSPSVFFVGDNQAHSQDSRHFGRVPLDQVTGRYRCTLPCLRIGE